MKKAAITGLFTLLLGVLLSFAPQLAQAQCSMCKTQVESARGNKEDYDASGLNKGILMLMTVPYVLMGVVGFIWYRHSKGKGK
jgi:hypothetical protein